jgi:norsolorinic acid ketoreductase
VAAVRNPSSVPEIKAAENSKVVVVRYDAGVVADAKAAIDELKSKHAVSQVDIVSELLGVL